MIATRITAVRVALAAGAAGLAAFVVRNWFVAALNALDRQLADVQADVAARTDLPEEVYALARRLGADAGKPSRYVDLRQSGSMWLSPDGTAQRFTARQRIGTSGSGFVWRAKIGPLGAIAVVDSLVDGRGLLEARLGGILSVSRIDGTDALNEGEGLRYLAELPLNPDAILFDHALDWSVVDASTLAVATGHGASRATITFALDDGGLIVSASAASRAFDATGKRYPWRGRFWDYQHSSGHLIPMQAEVAWMIDGEAFVYWRGNIEDWTLVDENTRS